MTVMNLFALLILFGTLSSAFADTPANCTFEDIKGKWVFSLGAGQNTRAEDCSTFSGPIKSQIQINLQFPDVATDQFGNVGFWTIIYNQGFEVVVAGRKYFAFSKFTQNDKKVISYCNQILPGWSHNVLGSDWSCYTGQKKDGTNDQPKVSIDTQAVKTNMAGVLKFKSEYFYNDVNFINSINSVQKSWRAVAYPHLEGKHKSEILNMVGGPASKVASRPQPSPVKRETLQIAARLPKAFDWRNVNGVNFVSPVRNQESCGSCYAFASLAMNEARVRIMTNNTHQPVFSPQDIVDCSEYSQGCDGGFPYLIGGKYAEDFGLVEESTNPYKGKDQTSCGTASNAKRYHSTKYEYVGGYYGACNEVEMRVALYQNGPVAIGFEVLPDFMHYKGGIYHHTGLTSGFTPFELTNHAVLVVGYGEDEATGEKYWITKNSWGTGWGEDGFFRISRGTDECAFESMAVQSTPVLTL